MNEKVLRDTSHCNCITASGNRDMIMIVVGGYKISSIPHKVLFRAIMIMSNTPMQSLYQFSAFRSWYKWLAHTKWISPRVWCLSAYLTSLCHQQSSKTLAPMTLGCPTWHFSTFLIMLTCCGLKRSTHPAVMKTFFWNLFLYYLSILKSFTLHINEWFIQSSVIIEKPTNSHHSFKSSHYNSK